MKALAAKGHGWWPPPVGWKDVTGFFGTEAFHVSLVGFAILLLLVAAVLLVNRSWGKFVLALVVALGLLAWEVQTVLALGAAVWAMFWALFR